VSVLATRRKEYRPHGTIAASCPQCAYFDICGGIDTGRPLLNCFDMFCPGDGKCHHVCPCQPDFIECMRDIRGLRFDDLNRITQVPLDLPVYIPVVHHGYRRVVPLNWPVVALDTYECFCLSSGVYTSNTNSPEELRASFRLGNKTQIVMRGTAKDKPLEKYWEYRRRDRVPEQLAALDVLAAIGPNFSHFLGVPRTDNLFNRKRQLICLEEFYVAGVPPIPHLNAVMPGDWRFWREYLAANSSVRVVAIECQTGNRAPDEGHKAFDSLARIQGNLGRSLHPVIIGGGQFIDFVAERFDKFTLMDSEPFMKAIKRRAFEPKRGQRSWRESFSLERQPIDDLVLRNIEGYGEWAESRLGSVRTQRPFSFHPPAMVADVSAAHPGAAGPNGKPRQPR